MKKIVQLLLIVAMLFSVSTVAYSAPGLYVGANIGLAFLDDSDVDIDDSFFSEVDISLSADNGASFGGVLGYAFENGYRVEGELVYQRNNYDEAKVSYLGMSDKFSMDGDISSATALANGYYDFKNKSRVTPFIGGGLGFAVVDVDGDPVDDHDYVFVYQFTAGVGFEITESITLDLKYRYVMTEDLELEGMQLEYSSDIISTGIRFTF